MAGIDYCSCPLCGKRMFYDGELTVRSELERNNTYLVCGHCVEKLQKKIEVLKKHDRRKH